MGCLQPTVIWFMSPMRITHCVGMACLFPRCIGLGGRPSYGVRVIVTSGAYDTRCNMHSGHGAQNNAIGTACLRETGHMNQKHCAYNRILRQPVTISSVQYAPTRTIDKTRRNMHHRP